MNKKFFGEEIKINKIIFPKTIKGKDKGMPVGFYRRVDKTIAIKKGLSEIDSLECLLHEYAHSFEHQILKSNRRGHSKEGGVMLGRFKRELDKIIKISLR